MVRVERKRMLTIDLSKRSHLSGEGGTNTIFFSSKCKNASHQFLSNMFLCGFSLEVDGISREFSSAEQAFQFLKLWEYKRHDKAIDVLKTANPVECKRRGSRRSVPLNDVEQSNWNNGKKIEVMRTVLRAKFSEAELMSKLLETWGFELVEKLPFRGDGFWGVSAKGLGANVLGQLLMEIRSAAQAAVAIPRGHAGPFGTPG